MKNFIASDFHERDPTGLVGALARDGEIDRAVFLGDYDKPRILRNILNLDIEKIVLMGNHDYEFCRGRTIYSSNLTKPLEMYWKAWGETPEGEYARNCPLKVEEGGIVYLHGSLVGVQAEDSPWEVWGRLKDFHHIGFSDERRLICNFREMKKAGYSTMFRGHDHESGVYFTDRETYSENFKQIRGDIFDRVLDKGDMNIVNVGAFMQGEYCLFDDDTRSLEFRNVGDR